MPKNQSLEENRSSGHHLGMAGAIRALAIHLAKTADPQNPEAIFTLLEDRAFKYVDGSSNPDFSGDTEKQIKEAAYGTLKMIFDRKGIEL